MKRLGNETSVKVVSFLTHWQKINLRTQSPSSARPPFRGVAAELVKYVYRLDPLHLTYKERDNMLLLSLRDTPHLMSKVEISKTSVRKEEMLFNLLHTIQATKLHHSLTKETRLAISILTKPKIIKNKQSWEMWDGTTFPFNNGTFDMDRNEIFQNLKRSI